MASNPIPPPDSSIPNPTAQTPLLTPTTLPSPSPSAHPIPLSALPVPNVLSQLILFDVNGILCTKITDPATERDSLIISPHYAIIVRPGIREFILHLSTRYTVGIYSSTTYANLVKILKLIFTTEQPFTIIADRSNTKLDPRFGVDPSIKSFDTIKTLDRIWEHPIFNAHRHWNAHNTLLLDHDLRKIDQNDPQNILLVPEFTPDTHRTQTNTIAELEAAILNHLQSLSQPSL